MTHILDTLRRSRRTLLADFAGVLMLAGLTLGILNLPGIV